MVSIMAIRNVRATQKRYACARRAILRMLAEGRRDRASKGFRRGAISVALDARRAYYHALDVAALGMGAGA